MIAECADFYRFSRYPKLSPYAYAANSPIRYIDQEGMGPQSTNSGFFGFTVRINLSSFKNVAEFIKNVAVKVFAGSHVENTTGGSSDLSAGVTLYGNGNSDMSLKAKISQDADKVDKAQQETTNASSAEASGTFTLKKEDGKINAETDKDIVFSGQDNAPTPAAKVGNELTQSLGEQTNLQTSDQ